MTTLDGRASHLALLPPGIIMCRGCMLLLSRHEWLGSPCLDFRLMAATTGTTMMKAGSTPNDQSGGPLEMMLGLKLVWCGWYVSLCGGLRCSMFTANLVSPLEPQGWGSVQEHRSGPDSWLHLLCSVSHNYDVTFNSAQVMMCHNVVRVVLVHLNHGTGKSSSASTTGSASSASSGSKVDDADAAAVPAVATRATAGSCSLAYHVQSFW